MEEILYWVWCESRRVLERVDLSSTSAMLKWLHSRYLPRFANLRSLSLEYFNQGDNYFLTATDITEILYIVRFPDMCMLYGNAFLYTIANSYIHKFFMRSRIHSTLHALALF